MIVLLEKIYEKKINRIVDVSGFWELILLLDL